MSYRTETQIREATKAIRKIKDSIRAEGHKVNVIYIKNDQLVDVLNTYMIEHLSAADFFRSEIEPYL